MFGQRFLNVSWKFPANSTTHKQECAEGDCKHSLFTTACLILFSELFPCVLFTSWRISDEVMCRSSRAGSRKRTFSAEEAAELVMENVFDDEKDFDDFLTVAKFAGEKNSSDDDGQPAASAASQ